MLLKVRDYRPICKQYNSNTNASNPQYPPTSSPCPHHPTFFLSVGDSCRRVVVRILLSFQSSHVEHMCHYAFHAGMISRLQVSVAQREWSCEGWEPLEGNFSTT